MNPLHSLARPEILALKPYSHAAWLPTLTRLHANEAPWRPSGDTTALGLNRYPEPQPAALIERLAALYGVPASHVLATRGADEAIDLLSRIYLTPNADAILQLTPTFGMYQLCARLQGADVIELPLRSDRAWALDADELLKLWRPHVKLVYLCSPNNPTANSFELGAIEAICTALDGKAVVVIDEAYVEWSRYASLTRWLDRFQTLAILRTLSKAQSTIEAALKALAPEELGASQQRVAGLLAERETLRAGLEASPLIDRVWPSDANFLLIDCRDAEHFMRNSMAAGFIVRDVRAHPALSKSLRVSVGTPADNGALLRAVGKP